MKVKIEVISNRERFEQVAQQAIENAMEQCGLLAEGYAQMALIKQKAVATGVLLNSMTHKVIDNQNEVAMYVGTNSEYAVYVETGTGKYVKGGRQDPWAFQDAKGNWHMTSGMKARPYVKPAIADHVNVYKEVIKDALEG